MDFFLDDIAHWIDEDDRLADDEFKPWSEQEFREFLEVKCLLSKEKLIKGRIIKNHHEAFFFWDELIKSSTLEIPFKVTHIDAHSDTGFGDAGYVYIMGELNNYPIEHRRKYLNTKKVYMGNYLAFALACGWIYELDFVLHESWDNDIAPAHLKNFSDKEKMFQLKTYPQNLNIGRNYFNIIDGTIPPIRLDKEIPYNLIHWKDYLAKEHFDYIVFCQSPGYTPKSADFMLDIIREYIIEI